MLCIPSDVTSRLPPLRLTDGLRRYPVAPSRLISYFRKRKMPMLGAHIAFLQAGMKFSSKIFAIN